MTTFKSLLFLENFLVALQDGLANFLDVLDHVVENLEVAEINALVDEVVATSVLTLHKAENLGLCESLDAQLELVKVATSDCFHENRLLVHELFSFLLLVEVHEGLVLLIGHLADILLRLCPLNCFAARAKVFKQIFFIQ